jgi:mannose-6-phosphate isomerase-like protein (cupin superfamily)
MRDSCDAETWSFNNLPWINPVEGIAAQGLRTAAGQIVCRMIGQGGTKIESHVHAHDHLLLVLSGRVTVTVGTEVRQLSDQGGTRIPAGITHSLVFEATAAVLEIGMGLDEVLPTKGVH